MRWLVLLAACGDNTARIDAAIEPDTQMVRDAQPVVYEMVSCLDGRVRGEVGVQMREHTCTAGCAVEIARMNLGARTVFTLEPTILCTETTSVLAGAGCNAPNFCLPTRAQIASDGTVEDQLYVACGEERCIPRIPPYFANYGEPCTPRAYDESDPSRAACLSVDGQTGATEYCVGDWECPAHMLCDDDVGTPRPVCKPGPRGVLTVEMLATAPS